MATLVAPLIAALAADGGARGAPTDPAPPGQRPRAAPAAAGGRRAALTDRARRVRLRRSRGVGVPRVELGSRWELEAAGVVLDWSRFPPRPAAGTPSREPAGGRAPQVLAAIRAL